MFDAWRSQRTLKEEEYGDRSLEICQESLDRGSRNTCDPLHQDETEEWSSHLNKIPDEIRGY